MTPKAERGEAADDPEPFIILGEVWFQPDGGAALYSRYLEAARPIAAKYLSDGINSFLPVEVLRGEFGPDLVFVNEYRSEEAFRELRDDPDYRAITPLRDEAIARANFVRLRRTAV